MTSPFRRNFDAARDPMTALNALGFARGTWTPVLTFATPGDLSVSYSAQVGLYLKEYGLVHIWFRVGTSAFTHTTAANALKITGVPFKAASNPVMNFRGEVSWSGITKANYTHIIPSVGAGDNQITFVAAGSGVALSSVTATDTPTGGTMNLQGHVAFLI